MIKCKEDMKGCYVPRADKEAFEAFMDKCEDFGVTWAHGDNPRDFKRGDYVVFSGMIYSKLTHGDGLPAEYREYKRLTIQDFEKEPSQKQYKYEPFEGSIFDLKDDLESRNVTYKNEAVGYVVVESEKRLLGLILANETIYIKKEIDWRESALDFIDECSDLDRNDEIISILYDPDFEAERKEFIELCHMVSDANKQ